MSDDIGKWYDDRRKEWLAAEKRYENAVRDGAPQWQLNQLRAEAELLANTGD